MGLSDLEQLINQYFDNTIIAGYADNNVFFGENPSCPADPAQ